MSARRRLLAILVGVAALAVAGSVLAGREFLGTGGVPPTLDVPQSASATDQGITLGVSNALFSGTETFLELSIDAGAVGEGAELFAVGVQSAYFAKSTIHPTERAPSIGLPADGSPAVVRFTPIPPDGPVVLAIDGLDLIYRTGERKVLRGTWELLLSVPADRAGSLRVESLRGAPAESNGIRLSPITAVRSTSETRVTLEVAGPHGVTLLHQPTLAAAGDVLRGVEVDNREGGKVITLSFPATPFGDAVELSIDAFVADAPGTGFTYVDVDLAGVMVRAGITPEHGAVAPVTLADVVAGSGFSVAEPLVQGIEFGRKSLDPETSVNVINFKIAGHYGLIGDFPVGESPFALRLADGSLVYARGAGDNFNADPTGASTEGTTTVSFLFESPSQIQGVVRLLNNTEPRSLVRGDWRIDLTPSP